MTLPQFAPPMTTEQLAELLEQAAQRGAQKALAQFQPAEASADTYYTVPEFAALRRCSDAVIYKAVSAGVLNSRRNGRRIVIPSSELGKSLDGVAA